jgi:hypothetical protein
MGFIRNISNIVSGKIAHLNEIAKPIKEDIWNRIQELPEEDVLCRKLMTLGFVGAYGSLEYEFLNSDLRKSELARRMKEINEKTFVEMFNLLFVTHLYIYTISEEFRHRAGKLLPEETLWTKTSEILRMNRDEITKILVRLEPLTEGHFSWAYDQICKRSRVMPEASAILQFEVAATNGYLSLIDSLRED